MTDIQAAVGRRQLSRLPHIVKRRRCLAERYHRVLGGLDGIELPVEPEWARSNWQSYCVRLPDGCDQRQVMQRMLEKGVSTRRGIMCAHTEPAYGRDQWKHHDRSIPADGLAESEKGRNRSIVLPLYPQMSEEEQDRVVDAFRQAMA